MKQLFHIEVINAKGKLNHCYYKTEGMARVCAKHFEQYGSKVVKFEEIEPINVG